MTTSLQLARCTLQDNVRRIGSSLTLIHLKCQYYIFPLEVCELYVATSSSHLHLHSLHKNEVLVIKLAKVNRSEKLFHSRSRFADTLPLFTGAAQQSGRLGGSPAA